MRWYRRQTSEGHIAVVSRPPIARLGSFFSVFRDLQSPLSGEKKSARTFSSPEKKEHLARGALARQAGCRWALGRLVGATNA